MSWIEVSASGLDADADEEGIEVATKSIAIYENTTRYDRLKERKTLPSL